MGGSRSPFNQSSHQKQLEPFRWLATVDQGHTQSGTHTQL